MGGTEPDDGVERPGAYRPRYRMRSLRQRMRRSDAGSCIIFFGEFPFAAKHIP